MNISAVEPEPIIEDNYGLYLLKSVLIVGTIVALSALITFLIV